MAKVDGLGDTAEYDLRAFDISETLLFTSSIFYDVNFPLFKFTHLTADVNGNTGSPQGITWKVENESSDNQWAGDDRDISDYEIFDVTDPNNALDLVSTDQNFYGVYVYDGDGITNGLKVGVRAVRNNGTLPDYKNRSTDYGLSVQMPV